ncbi:MAG TPA: histidine kinase [Pseudonocardiaceae bacterium]|jgi:two-component system LytT family sensor kinase
MAPVPELKFSVVLVVLAVGLLLVLGAVLVILARTRRGFASDVERATYTALHTMALASPPLRDGLSAASATAAAPHLRALLDCAAVAITTEEPVMLAWDGAANHHTGVVAEAAVAVSKTGRQQVLNQREMDCGRMDCPVRAVIVSPLEVDGGIVGTLAVVSHRVAQAGVMRATAEVARYVSSQLELAELDESRSRLATAEVRALRAQISPHFVYNALTTISSHVRTDPDEARELLMEFAEFTRYSFRTAGEFTTLAEELNNIDRYLVLEKARFGERLQVKLQIAPEVLPVVLPFLALQPLVENAVRHGLAGQPEGGTVSVIAEDAGTDCVISVEDDGVGMNPARLRDEMKDSHVSGAHVGLGNVHDRLRAAFGDECGLVVETGPGAGTKVSMRVPKFSRGVRAAAPPPPSPSRSLPPVSA